MKVVALISGGKDSCYAMYLAQQHGHEVVALANLLPMPDQPDELNSYMYQTVGHQLVEAYATCTGLPLFRKHIKGRSAQQGLQYTRTEGDEVEDLYCLLSYVKEAIPVVGAVTSGAIASDYQRLRVENVCARLNLVSLSYLWHQPQRQLLRGMIESGLHAVMVKVAALGLDPHKHLGKSLAQLEPYLHKLNTLYGSHVCGEGGEYESLTLDCPLFQHARIVIDSSEVVSESEDMMAPVAYLRPTAFHLEAKQPPATSTTGTPRASDQLSSSPLASHSAQAQLRALVLPRASVHVVPEQYASSYSSSDKNLCRSTVVPVSYTSHVRIREETDYIQATCWAHRSSGHHALSSDLTENDTACALLEVLEALQQQLASRGVQLTQALYVHLLLANMGHFAAANSVYCRVLPPVDPPSRACFQLPLPSDMPLMLDVLLAKHATPPDQTATGQAGCEAHDGTAAGKEAGPLVHYETPPKRVLHVQSISSWAPSCIGPYSQATAYKGLVHMAGTIPLHAPSMTLSGGDALTQAAVALSHVQAVATAMRTCCMRAALGLVVLYCSSIGTAGKEQLQDEVQRLLSEGATSPKLAQARQQQWRGPSFADLGPLHITDEVQQDGGSGQGLSEVEEEEEEAAEGELDPYLQPPAIRKSIRANVMYVAVPALPRGCLVEVQPLLLDVCYLDALMDAMIDGVEMSSSSNSSSSAGQGPAGSSTVTTPPTSNHIQSSRPAAGEPAAVQLSADSAVVEAVDSPAQQLGHIASPRAGLNSSGAATHPDVSQVKTTSRASPSHLLSGKHVAGSAPDITVDSCHTSVCSSLDLDCVAGCNPHAMSAGVGGVGGAPCSGHLASANQLSPERGGAAAGGAPPTCCDNVMVSTVHCQQYGLLRSLYHLPADVFIRPDVNQRLRQAVQGMLTTYDVPASDLMHLRGWYDTSQVSAEAAQQMLGEVLDGWHVCWMPCLNVSTTVCPCGTAAVLEVLAQVQG